MSMTLYSIGLSPFAARCRMQIRAKGLEVEILDPPGGTTSPEYRDLTPIGKVPLLDTGAMRIPECQVICEYLEDTYPEISLRGRTPETTAMVRLLCRVVDVYVFEALGPLFPQLRAETKNEVILAAQAEKITKALDTLDHFVADGHYAVDNRLSLADCALMPAFIFVEWMLKTLNMSVQLADYPKLAGYFEAILKDEHAAATHKEIQEGLAAMMAG